MTAADERTVSLSDVRAALDRLNKEDPRPRVIMSPREYRRLLAAIEAGRRIAG